MPKINYRDFIAAMLERHVSVSPDHLAEIFNRFQDPSCPGELKRYAGPLFIFALGTTFKRFDEPSRAGENQV